MRRHLHDCIISLIEDACVHKTSLTPSFLLKCLFIRAMIVSGRVFGCYGYRFHLFIRFIRLDVGTSKKNNEKKKEKKTTKKQDKQTKNKTQDSNIIKQYIKINEKIKNKPSKKIHAYFAY